MHGMPSTSIDLSWICRIMAAVCSRVCAASCITLRMEPTLYSPMILSSLAGSMASWVSSSMTMMESWTSWPAFSLRVMPFSTFSTLASTAASRGMAGLTAGREAQAHTAKAVAANDMIWTMDLNRFIYNYATVLRIYFFLERDRHSAVISSRVFPLVSGTSRQTKSAATRQITP